MRNEQSGIYIHANFLYNQPFFDWFPEFVNIQVFTVFSLCCRYFKRKQISGSIFLLVSAKYMQLYFTDTCPLQGVVYSAYEDKLFIGSCSTTLTKCSI